ncbi:MAG: mycofactocin biosynthesis peptidyl-dipeptidase MftE [Acidimicrobiales bacterium]
MTEPPPERRLGRLTSPEAAAAQPVVLLVPLGSTEQHGPHLPLDTDTRIAVALCEAAAGSGGRRLVSPPVCYGASGEHAGFAGTLSIGTEALCRLLVELVRSADGFGATVLVSAHGGNAAALRAAVRILAAEGRAVAAWSPRIAGGDAHAGATETSIMLVVEPGAVRLDRIEAGARDGLEQLWPVLRSGGILAVSPSGVLGDPTAASSRHGLELMEQLVSDLDQAIAVLERAISATMAP